jgi:hypothetical protein
LDGRFHLEDIGLFKSAKKVLLFNDLCLKFGINYFLTQRHKPEKGNILICLSGHMKKIRNEFHFFRRLELKSTNPKGSCIQIVWITCYIYYNRRKEKITILFLSILEINYMYIL